MSNTMPINPFPLIYRKCSATLTDVIIIWRLEIFTETNVNKYPNLLFDTGLRFHSACLLQLFQLMCDSLCCSQSTTTLPSLKHTVQYMACLQTAKKMKLEKKKKACARCQTAVRVSNVKEENGHLNFKNFINWTY